MNFHLCNFRNLLIYRWIIPWMLKMSRIYLLNPRKSIFRIIIVILYKYSNWVSTQESRQYKQNKSKIILTIKSNFLTAFNTSMYNFAYKDLRSLSQHVQNHLWFQKTVEHDIGQRSFLRSSFLIQFYHVQSRFSCHIEVLLYIFILNATKILTKVYVQQPVHRFYRPFQPSMDKKLLRCKRTTANIVMPFTCFALFCFKFCMN